MILDKVYPNWAQYFPLRFPRVSQKFRENLKFSFSYLLDFVKCSQELIEIRVLLLNFLRLVSFIKIELFSAPFLYSLPSPAFAHTRMYLSLGAEFLLHGSESSQYFDQSLVLFREICRYEPKKFQGQKNAPVIRLSTYFLNFYPILTYFGKFSTASKN